MVYSKLIYIKKITNHSSIKLTASTCDMPMTKYENNMIYYYSVKAMPIKH
jgi:hypothetical protein